MATYRLHEWAVTSTDDGFLAPELVEVRLVGRRAEDGKRVVTSPIRQANGRAIETASGSVYVLEDASQDYVAYLTSIGRILDVENPIKIVHRQETRSLEKGLA